MFVGVNMLLARLKMSSEKGQKHIYAQEHQLYWPSYSVLSTSLV